MNKTYKLETTGKHIPFLGAGFELDGLFMLDEK